MIFFLNFFFSVLVQWSWWWNYDQCIEIIKHETTMMKVKNLCSSLELKSIQWEGWRKIKSARITTWAYIIQRRKTRRKSNKDRRQNILRIGVRPNFMSVSPFCLCECFCKSSNDLERLSPNTCLCSSGCKSAWFSKFSSMFKLISTIIDDVESIPLLSPNAEATTTQQ